MGMFDWLKGKNDGAERPPPASDSMILANDIVLSMLIGPTDGPADALLARVEAGEFTPVVLDASLYWAMSAIEPTDEIQAGRMARLLRYARILPLERDSDERGHPAPSADEIAHWREVVFQGHPVVEIDPAQVAPSGAGGPTMLCSQCFSQCQGRDAHVIPWWNEGEGDFFTTYRCGSCWLGSLDETRARTTSLDEDSRAKLSAFLRRHRLNQLATEIDSASMAEASSKATQFVEQVRAGKTVLQP